MTIDEIAALEEFEYVTKPVDKQMEVSKVYCCDLLSVAMRDVPQRGVWCTIMNNNNTLAVAALTECACIILCEGIQPTKEVIETAKEQEICLMKTRQPIFEAALEVHNKIHGA
ncbi:DRTGG domain-containing protein [Eubacterium oxidoreducens]|uniref:DRTGG domain-containing protein n=1 Tax=Eubacterium oxidoreducens TaxID=1732 RepID=A0A1G6BVG5_EUBOX|nr:DRTGG domain-containing protein [Eubacterium oxidoreducens]SDB24590.1 DRTGG domain-containing protein [Eubacterium oxidoreducens]